MASSTAAVADWIRVVCFPDRWLDLRYVGPAAASGSDDLLRGIIARRGGKTVVALRNAQLVTFTAMDIHDARALVPVLGVGLAQRPPARFDEFSLPAQVGARADERLRNGAPLTEVLDYLGIPQSARAGGRVGVHRAAQLRGDRRGLPPRWTAHQHRSGHEHRRHRRGQGAGQPIARLRRRMDLHVQPRNPVRHRRRRRTAHRANYRKATGSRATGSPETSPAPTTNCLTQHLRTIVIHQREREAMFRRILRSR